MVLVAVLLRVGWVLLVPTRPVGDFAMYIESAVFLLEHGKLDPEFVYMPGYVGFCAAILSVLGVAGGVLAIKVIVAVAAGLCAGAIHGIAAALWDERAGVLAAAAYTFWPAGIAVGSVTGTDLPAAILLVTAVFVLVRFAPTRPWLAVVGFGLLMGIAAWVRAVMVPLAGFCFFYFWWSTRAGGPGGRWRKLVRSLGPAVVASVVALAVLAPWAWRNHRRYGEWFVTDSHGGLTALVGANPNTDGRYSRSLNRMFFEITGYTLLAEPHRAADRASYVLAREWVRFSPAYAVGLVAAKAERLLARERPLLYWPLYRAGVLSPGPVKSFVDRHRRVIEGVVDAGWWLLAAGFSAGVGLAVVRRRWDAIWFLPITLALAGIYAAFFAEVRYHLPIAILMFPVAGGALIFLREAAAHVRKLRRVPKGLWREVRYAFGAAVLIVGSVPGLAYAGAHLRDRHRFAVHVCAADNHTRACLWRSEGRPPSRVRGVWNGVGLRIGGTTDARVAARTQVSLPAGRYWLRAEWDLAPAEHPAVAGAAGALGGRSATLRAGVGVPVLVRAPLFALAAAAADGAALPIEVSVEHPGGPLPITLEVDTDGLALPPETAVWLSRLALVPAAGAPATNPGSGDGRP